MLPVTSYVTYLKKRIFRATSLPGSLCLCLLNDNGDPGNEVDISRTCTCIYLTLKVCSDDSRSNCWAR